MFCLLAFYLPTSVHITRTGQGCVHLHIGRRSRDAPLFAESILHFTDTPL